MNTHNNTQKGIGFNRRILNYSDPTRKHGKNRKKKCEQSTGDGKRFSYAGVSWLRAIAQPLGGWWRKRALLASTHLPSPHPGNGGRCGTNTEPCLGHLPHRSRRPIDAVSHHRTGRNTSFLFESHFPGVRIPVKQRYTIVAGSTVFIRQFWMVGSTKKLRAIPKLFGVAEDYLPKLPKHQFQPSILPVLAKGDSVRQEHCAATWNNGHTHHAWPHNLKS